MKFALCMLALLCGCAATLQPAMPPLGAAARTTFAMQILDPDASRARHPVTGMDGRSAAAAQQRYQKSFSEPAQDSTSVVSKK
jgi:hypothetical protein